MTRKTRIAVTLFITIFVSSMMLTIVSAWAESPASPTDMVVTCQEKNRYPAHFCKQVMQSIIYTRAYAGPEPM